MYATSCLIADKYIDYGGICKRTFQKRALRTGLGI